MGEGDPLKTITGYCEPWSLRAGESITLRASSHEPGPAELALVRLHCGDPTKAGPGFDEEVVASTLPSMVHLADQPLVSGSWGEIDLSGLAVARYFDLSFGLRATLPTEPQSVLSLGDFTVSLENSTLYVGRGGQRVAVRQQVLDPRRWYQVDVSFDVATGRLIARCTASPSASPGRDLLEAEPCSASVVTEAGPITDLRQLLLASHDGASGDFDGRLGAISLTVDDTRIRWDLSQMMDTPHIVDAQSVDATGTGFDGVLHQLPTRAITGPAWDGSVQDHKQAPHHYDAVHFHKTDLYDAGWAGTAELALPSDLASGIYCFRLTQGEQVDRVPFFVRPGPGRPTSDVALLMSSATYIAYADHRMLFEGADFIPTRSRLRPEHEYVRQHPELGRSMYEKHLDGSGVMFSSRLRPVLNARPGADGWNFTPDTDINAWLQHTGIGHDVIGDEDVHIEGKAALAPYRVIVTGSHPEYWSTAMLDALSAWQRDGGRLMYLGANGFYWRVAFSDGWPGAMELRRAEDGVRNWQTEDGENYHAFGGEYGGMWRRNGRPPNEIAGVGFAAQGFDRATHYDVNVDSMTGRTAWIWDGVTPDEGRIGTAGLGGGAAGQEIDRYDLTLGSPPHAVVLASATDFGPEMLRTKEEFEGSVMIPTPDPYVRADIVFYETPGGGAVFSTGSIAWFGSLARDGYENDTAVMSTNVLRRFADPAPFAPPIG